MIPGVIDIFAKNSAMRIKILRILNDRVVEFSSNAGNGIGTWRGTDLKQGGVYGIEIDIDTQINLGVNATMVSDTSWYIRHTESRNELQGVIDGVDEDGLAYLRLAIDCIVMVESSNKDLSTGDTLLLTIEPNELILTPVGVILNE